MMQSDPSYKMIEAEVARCKADVHLTPETQYPVACGHSSAPDPGSVKQSDAVPGGAPGISMPSSAYK